MDPFQRERGLHILLSMGGDILLAKYCGQGFVRNFYSKIFINEMLTANNGSIKQDFIVLFEIEISKPLWALPDLLPPSGEKVSFEHFWNVSA